MISKLLRAALLIPALLAPSAFAANITYATINPATPTGTTGTIGSVGFTYTGEYAFINASNTGQTNYFLPTSTYTSATVPNAPTDGALIGIQDTGVTDTFTFSTPVTNLLFEVVSLGQGGIPTTYTFDSNFTVLSCGGDIYWGGSCFTSGGVGTSGNVLTGAESDGTIEFAGPISELSFTTAYPEYWNGFDIGLGPQTATPEPNSLILLGTGLVGVLGAAKRKFAR